MLPPIHTLQIMHSSEQGSERGVARQLQRPGGSVVAMLFDSVPAFLFSRISRGNLGILIAKRSCNAAAAAARTAPPTPLLPTLRRAAGSASCVECR
jgi:hypothetical protein